MMQASKINRVMMNKRSMRPLRAASEDVPSPTTAAPVTFKSIPPLVWEQDKETVSEVFAFGGSAPERANGRAAMLAFASVASTELSQHTPALEQTLNSIPAIVLLSLTLTLATIVPKLVSGSSLSDLHKAASSENLKTEGLGAALALFDQSLELWSGRLAMIGFSGLIITELVKGDALF